MQAPPPDPEREADQPVNVGPPARRLLPLALRVWNPTPVSNINSAVATLPPIILALATGFLVVKLIQRHRSTQRPRRPPDYDQYQ